jgi:ribosomal protein L35AE/L33A
MNFKVSALLLLSLALATRVSADPPLRGVASAITDGTLDLDPQPVLVAFVKCDSAAACSNFVIHRTDGSPLDVRVTRVEGKNLALTVSFEGQLPADLSEVVLFAKDVPVKTLTGSELHDFQFYFAVSLIDIGDATLVKLKFAQPVTLPRLEDIKVKASDNDGTFEVPLLDVQPSRNPNELIVTFRRPLPNARTFRLTAQVNGQLTAEGTVTTPAWPSRAEAAFYGSGSANLTQGAKDTYGLDVRIDRVLLPRKQVIPDTNRRVLELASFDATVDVIAGSDALKLPDYGRVSLPVVYRDRLWSDSGPTTLGRLTFGPEYATDKKLDNQDLGVNASYRRYRGFERGDAVWKTALEAGTEDGFHLTSSHPELRHEAFLRFVARPSVKITWHDWSLDLTPELRYLFRNELAGDEDGSLVATRKGFRTYVRTELSRDLGWFSLTIANMSGRVPPLYKRARATTIGVTFRR